MKKNTNRALSILLALLMILSMLPASALAESDAPAMGTDIVIENRDGKEEDTAKEGGSPSDPGELPGTGEDKEQDDNKGGEEKTAESNPLPVPSKAPAKKAAPALNSWVEPPSTTPPATPSTQDPSGSNEPVNSGPSDETGEGGVGSTEGSAPGNSYPEGYTPGGNGAGIDGGITASVTLSASPAEGGTVTGGGTFEIGATATVTAAPAPGCVFVRWMENGAEVSGSAAYSFKIEAAGDRNLTAVFQAATYTVSITGVNSTYVTVSGAGTYQYGETATVSFAFNENRTGAFSGWEVNGGKVADDMVYTFTVTEDVTLTPKYLVGNDTIGVIPSSGEGGGKNGKPGLPGHGENGNEENDPDTATYPVTMACDPTDGGAISVTRNSPTTGGTESFAQGETVYLQITVNSGYTLGPLTMNETTLTAQLKTGGGTGGKSVYTASFDMPDGDAAVKVNFPKSTHTVTLAADPASIGAELEGGSSYPAGTEITVKTEKYISGIDGSFKFEGWYAGNTKVGSDAAYTFTVIGDTSLTAKFKKIVVFRYNISSDTVDLGEGIEIGDIKLENAGNRLPYEEHEKITLTWNGNPVGQWWNTVNPMIAVDPTELGVGTHTLTLSYPGSDGYCAASADISVTVVKKLALQLMDFAPVVAAVNAPYIVSGRIVDEIGDPYSGKPVNLSVQISENNAGFRDLGSVNTDQNGAFSKEISEVLPTASGSRQIKVIAGDDDTYKRLSEFPVVNFVDQLPTHDVTFIIENGAWDDDTAQKTVTLTYGSTIQATDLPVPKPDAGWGVGAWDTDPVGKSVTGNATYTWTYKHYKVSYVLVNADAAIGAAPAERGTQWWSTESREVIGGDALDLRPTVLDERYDFGGTWYSDQDCTQPAKAWAEVSGDVTLYGKWTGPYTLIEQVLLSFTPPAVGDPIPTGQYYADGSGDGLPSELGVTQPDSMDGTTLVYHAAYELDGVEATSFQSGKTYTLRVIIDAMDKKTHRFKGHGGGPEYALTVTGAAGSLDYVSPTQTAVYLDFTPQQPQAPDSSVTVEITSNCEALYGFDGLPSYRFYDGDKIMLPIGDIITYSITVRSTGKDRADNIVIDIAVSNAFTLREGDWQQSIPPLGPGAEHTVEINLEINRMPAAGETFDVTATAQWDGMQAPASETNKLKVRYSIITSADPAEGGSITAPLLGVEGPQTISYAPNQGYRLKSLTIDGRALSLINGFLHITETLDGQALSVSDYPSSYTFTEITQNHLFTAEFAEAYDLTDVSVQQSGTLTYSGNPRTASVTASATAVNNETVTFSYSAEQNGPYTAEVPAFTNAGTYTVYYKASAADHNDAAGSFTVTVEPKTVTEADFTALPTVSKTYNGKAQTQEITSATLTEGTDYEVVYTANINAGTAGYTVKGKGNYTGSIGKSFTIEKADPTVTGVSVTAPATVYDTTAIGDIVLGFTADPSGGSIKLDDGQMLEVGEKDYNWTYTPKDSDIANYNTATGKMSITVEKKTNPPQPSTISYAAKDGSGNTIQSVTWQKGSGKNLDLTFKRSEDDHLTYGLFGSLEIGGVTVGSANYGAAEGSLKLSIKPEYLETLDLGDHTVKVNFQDGSATVKLTVKAAAAQPQKPGETPASPKTGDESNLALWGSLMFLSFAAMNVLLLYARKRKIEE